MKEHYKLTITVLTMNRVVQLINALDSCLASVLPDNTQFVIVDNASTDETETVVKNYIEKHKNYDFIYKRLPENRGVGGGRNVCYDLSLGEYVYFLDDDAEIAPECREIFFINSIKYLDRNPIVATLTTYIVDKVFGDRTGTLAKSKQVDGLRAVYKFHGGSVFIRSKCFSKPLFMDIAYGGEELAVSMKAMDDGFVNVYDPNIFINHLPANNKWVDNKDYINMLGASNTYVLKRRQYPCVFHPILWGAYQIRLKRYNLTDKGMLKEFKVQNRKKYKEFDLKRVKLSTVIISWIEFGMTTF